MFWGSEDEEDGDGGRHGGFWKRRTRRKNLGERAHAVISENTGMIEFGQPGQACRCQGLAMWGGKQTGYA